MIVNRKYYKIYRLYNSVCLLLLAGCKSYDEQENELPDNTNKGTIKVSADESFKPVIDELVQVYESNHPGTKINVSL